MRNLMRSIVLIVVIVVASAAGARAADNGFPTVGVNFGSPTNLGAFVNETIGFGDKSNHALLLHATGGVGGGELGVGVGRGTGELSIVSARAVVIRTWGHPLGVAPGQTFGDSGWSTTSL